MTARGWGSSRQTLRKAAGLDRRGLADGAAEQSALDRRVEAVAAVHDVAGEMPRPRARERLLLRLGVELMQERRFELDEEQHFRGDSVGRTPDQPVLGIDADLEVDEARGERGRHAVDHAAVALAVAAGDERRALGERVLADFAFERELIKCGLYHRHTGREFFQVDEPEAGVVGRRQEHRRRPAGAVGGVAPRDAAQVHGVEQERPDVDIFAATVRRDLLRDHRFCRAGWPPDHSRLTGFDEKGEGRGELARAERVVRGNGCGLGHGQDSGMAGRRRGRNPLGARRPPLAGC